MKKVTFSLLTCCLMSTLISADDLQKAFKETKMTGELKAQYFNKQFLIDGKNDAIGVVGGNINLNTGSYYGFGAGLTFQTSHRVSKSIKGLSNEYINTMDVSGSVLSQSYLSYSLTNTVFKIGRQYITTPLLAGSGSRMIKQSFEGITLENKSLPKTTITVAYVNKFQNRTNGTGSAPKFNSINKNAYTLYVTNNSIDNLTLRAQVLKVNANKTNTDKSVRYFDAAYNLSGVNIAGQYINSKNDKEKGSLFGLKVNGNIAMINLTGIYTKTNSDGTVYSGVGGAADSSFAALPLHGGSVTYTKDTNTKVLIAATNIKDVTIVGYVGQVKSDHKVGPLKYKKIDAMGGFVQYAFNKNFSAKVMYESADFDTAKHDDNIFRVYTSYKF